MQTITSRKNPLLQHMKKLGRDGAYRASCAEFLCEGGKLYQEALLQRAPITRVLSCDKATAAAHGDLGVFVPQDVLESLSTLKTPQTVLFSVKFALSPLPSLPSRILVLDGMQDPGNVGTMIRTARAFGADGLILTGRSADLYHPKTVRATMGALFNLSVSTLPYDQLQAFLQKENLPLFGAALGENAHPLPYSFPNRAAIAIGSEGAGLSQKILSMCIERVQIPMATGVESLNAAVAGSVLLWELWKT